MNLKQRQSIKLNTLQKVVVTASVSAVIAIVLVFGVKLFAPKESMASAICGSTVSGTTTISTNTICSGDVTINGGTLIVEAELSIAGELEILGGGELIIKNLGTLTIGEITSNKNGNSIEVEPGGWFYCDEGLIKKGTFVNNGYFEHTGDGSLNVHNVNITGNGVIYIADETAFSTPGTGKVFGKTSSQISSDDFLTGSTTLSVKRLPKFKVQVDGLELGDSLVIVDTLDLNGKNIDIKDKDFKMPNSRSFHRNGDNTEYIKTSSTGKYTMTILKNDKEYIAPIGRNPYLPVTAQCEDCEGTQFAVSVTENVYLDPDLQNGLQTSNAVGETWSIIPDRNITGDITFELQWNNGNDGTTSSELTSFNRSSVTPRFWVVGQSSQWQNDGVNLSVSASNNDPAYSVQIVMSGLTQDQEYLFSVGSSGSALPVEFLYFDAELIGDKIELTWATATETNNDFFEIQRSEDGAVWEALDKVSGFGTTLKQQDYIAYDNSPLAGLAYYRLKQVDFDGTTDYSDVKQVESNGVSGSELEIKSIYPNPFTSILNVEVQMPTAGDVMVSIISSAGATIKSENTYAYEGVNSIILNDLANLEKGAYIILVEQGSKRLTKTILKR